MGYKLTRKPISKIKTRLLPLLLGFLVWRNRLFLRACARVSVLWLVASILFSVYVANFGSYNKTYGSLGAVVVLLMWLYLSAYIVLIGAELNSEMEHQTARDTTRGEEQPMGQRGAQKADTVGESP